MSEAKANVAVEMPKNKRLLFIIAVYMLYAGFSASGYGSSVLLPAKLAGMNGMSFYALGNALGTLGMMLVLPLVGSLCDKFGSKTVTLFGVFLQLAIRLVMMVFSSNVFVYLALFCVQSMGSGLYISAPYSLITDVTEPAERPKFFGYLVATRALGSLLGPLLTGYLMDLGYADLGWISYLPFMLFSVPVILSTYPNIKTQKVQGKFDLGGILLLVLAISGIVMWLSLGGKQFEWVSIVSAILLAVGVVSLVALIRRELKHPNPSVPVKVFAHKRFSTAFLCFLLLTAYSTSSAGFVIAFAQQVMNVSSTVSATVTIPQTIIQAVCSAFVGGFIGKNFAKRFRPVSLLSLALVTVASFLFFILTPTSSMMMIYAGTLIGGFAQIAPQTVFTPFFQSELKPEEYRSAQSMFSFASTGGACIFSAFAGVIMNAGLGFNSVFLLATIMCAASLVIGFFGLRTPIPKEAPAKVGNS